MRTGSASMKVTFTRTGTRKYRVSVEGDGLTPSYMEPAPGYDDRLPHDMAHFVVENELRIVGGIFGQLAKGGHARHFRPLVPERDNRRKRLGDRIAAENAADALLSERVIDLAFHAWEKRNYEGAPVQGISDDDIARVCRAFEVASSEWRKLEVGGSVTFEWTAARRRRP